MNQMKFFHAGQPVIGADGNPIYYQHPYHHPQAGGAAGVAYLANGANPATYMSQQGQYMPYYYVQQQPGQQQPQQQQQPHQQQQQQPQQPGVANPAGGASTAQGNQYYIMQSTQSGHYVYLPTQVSPPAQPVWK